MGSENGFTASTLREVDVDIVSNTQCNDALVGVTDRMICAGGIKGYDACQGDSGGPFFTSKDNNPILVGAVSWGIGCPAMVSRACTRALALLALGSTRPPATRPSGRSSERTRSTCSTLLLLLLLLLFHHSK